MAAILHLVLLTIFLMKRVEASCPNNTDSGPLKYTRGMNNATFGYGGLTMPLDCCMTGYVSLTWTFRHNRTQPWQPIGGSLTYRLIDDNRNQTLRIFPPNASNDYPLKGDYRCTATSASNTTLDHTVNLKVQGCLGRQIPRSSGPSSLVCSRPGETLMANCTGHFGGCLNPAEWDVSWYYMDNNIPRPLHNLNDSRIHSLINNSTKGRSVHQLVIQNLTKADFGKRFACFVSSVRDIHNRRFPITIVPCPQTMTTLPVDKVKVAMIVLGVVVAFVLLATLLSVLVWGYWPQIHDQCHSWRYMGWIRLETHDIRVVVYHGGTPADQALAEYIKEDLIEASYDVVISSDILAAGVADRRPFQAKLRQAAALVIVSPSPDTELDELETIGGMLQEMDCNIDRITVIVPKVAQEVVDLLKGYKHLIEPEDHTNHNCRLTTNFRCDLKRRIRVAGVRNHARQEEESDDNRVI